MAGTAPPRRQARFILGLVLILAALPLGYFVFLYQPPPPPLPPPLPPPVETKAPEAKVEMQITELSGAVEIRLADGAWQELKPGMTLHASDSLRTKDGSSATITNGKVTVTMEPATEVALRDLSDTLSDLLLGSGMATVSVSPGARHVVKLQDERSTAVASATQGTFTMNSDGAGTVAVGSREGDVKFEGNGKVVIVRTGEQSVLRPGSGPSEPMQIPSSLLRKVQWPAARQNKRDVVVQGVAAPGTRLQIGGQTLSPNPDGTFKQTVRLKEGENEVTVKAFSVGGSKEEDQRKVTVDTTAPTMKVKLPWDTPAEGQSPPSPTP